VVGVLRARGEREREEEGEKKKNKKKLTFSSSKINTPNNPQPAPLKPGIQARQPQHDLVRIQVDLLDGVGSPDVGTLFGIGLCAPGLLFFVC